MQNRPIAPPAFVAFKTRIAVGGQLFQGALNLFEVNLVTNALEDVADVLLGVALQVFQHQCRQAMGLDLLKRVLTGKLQTAQQIGVYKTACCLCAPRAFNQASLK